ncbi:MAG TPA: type II toxin-antitoxin system PemK/MazF family toxin [Candidatus Saccharimonadia bacterium]|nr:type II toxin-antitoxin system PemK/MazF family toxin [Candidatus Saccharimonadia bacterium]
MDSFTVGDVVLVPFPYADFSKFKKRPALVVGLADFDNLILCQITSRRDASIKAIALIDDEFTRGNLSIKSYIRPDKLFTIERSIIEKKIGTLSKTKIKSVQAHIRQIFN